MFKINKKTIGIVIVVFIVFLFLVKTTRESFTSQNPNSSGPVNFAGTTDSKEVPLNYGPAKEPPSGDFSVKDVYNQPPDCGKTECPSSRRNKYDYPNTSLENDSFYGPIGPFYKIDGQIMENPDFEQMKYYDQVDNIYPNDPLAKRSILKLEGKDSPYAGPRFYEASMPATFIPKQIKPDGLNSEIRYAQLYGNDTMPKGQNDMYSPDNVNRLTDHILMQKAFPEMNQNLNMYPANCQISSL